MNPKRRQIIIIIQITKITVQTIFHAPRSISSFLASLILSYVLISKAWIGEEEVALAIHDVPEERIPSAAQTPNQNSF
jgi:hypothetical protein